MNRYVIINAPKTPSVIDVKDAKIFKTEYCQGGIYEDIPFSFAKLFIPHSQKGLRN